MQLRVKPQLKLLCLLIRGVGWAPATTLRLRFLWHCLRMPENRSPCESNHLACQGRSMALQLSVQPIVPEGVGRCVPGPGRCPPSRRGIAPMNLYQAFSGGWQRSLFGYGSGLTGLVRAFQVTLVGCLIIAALCLVGGALGYVAPHTAALTVVAASTAGCISTLAYLLVADRQLKNRGPKPRN